MCVCLFVCSRQKDWNIYYPIITAEYSIWLSNILRFGYRFIRYSLKVFNTSFIWLVHINWSVKSMLDATIPWQMVKTMRDLRSSLKMVSNVWTGQMLAVKYSMEHSIHQQVKCKCINTYVMYLFIKFHYSKIGLHLSSPVVLMDLYVSFPLRWGRFHRY